MDVSWLDLVPRPARWDISVPLSRTRIPLIVLQDRLCSVHAAQAFSGDWRRGPISAALDRLPMPLDRVSARWL
jgi:hypothetical protein